jgi:hypothetical protein
MTGQVSLIRRGKKEKCDVTASATYMSFLVRMWQEHSPNLPETMADWHSEVEHIQSGQQWVFHTLETLLCFLQEMADDPEALTRSEM